MLGKALCRLDIRSLDLESGDAVNCQIIRPR